MALLWSSSALSFLQVPMRPFPLLLCFNLFSQSAPPILLTAATYWGYVLSLSSPTVIVMEGLGSLFVPQKLGNAGRELAGVGEVQCGFCGNLRVTLFAKKLIINLYESPECSMSVEKGVIRYGGRDRSAFLDSKMRILPASGSR